jgi:hypothetical protein
MSLHPPDVCKQFLLLWPIPLLAPAAPTALLLGRTHGVPHVGALVTGRHLVTQGTRPHLHLHLLLLLLLVCRQHWVVGSWRWSEPIYSFYLQLLLLLLLLVVIGTTKTPIVCAHTPVSHSRCCSASCRRKQRLPLVPTS